MRRWYECVIGFLSFRCERQVRSIWHFKLYRTTHVTRSEYVALAVYLPRQFNSPTYGASRCFSKVSYTDNILSGRVTHARGIRPWFSLRCWEQRHDVYFPFSSEAASCPSTVYVSSLKLYSYFVGRVFFFFFFFFFIAETTKRSRETLLRSHYL